MNRFLPALPLLLSGCVMNSSVARGLAEVPAGQGLVVFSTGSRETTMSTATGLEVRAADSRLPYKGGLGINIDFSMEGSDFQDEHGRVRMVALEPGDYCLYPALRNPYFKFTGKPPQFAFHVRAGTVSYIGSIFLANSSLSVRDRRERDLNQVRAQNPGLKDLAVEQQLVRGNPECPASATPSSAAP